MSCDVLNQRFGEINCNGAIEFGIMRIIMMQRNEVTKKYKDKRKRKRNITDHLLEENGVRKEMKYNLAAPRSSAKKILTLKV